MPADEQHRRQVELLVRTLPHIAEVQGALAESTVGDSLPGSVAVEG